MISCKFLVSSVSLPHIECFIEKHEISNVSFFENAKLGFSDNLDESGFPIANFFDVEILVETIKDGKEVEEKLLLEFRNQIKEFRLSELKEEDWVDLYTRELKPVICENFYFYNDSIQQAPTNKGALPLVPVKLNSALAFGSGHHQTTQSCLKNMLYLSEHRFSPQRILDMGCGTGILGICALKIWSSAGLVGIDMDPEAIRVTRDNCVLNNIIPDDLLVASDLKNMQSVSKFDLILCNILKQPLIDLSKEFHRILNDGGYIITSGFITSQESEIVRCYEDLKFELCNRIQSDDWLSILFRKNDQ